MVIDTVANVRDEDRKPYEEDQTVKDYPKAEEELADFLNLCWLKDFDVMMCLRCNSVFDKEVAKEREMTNPYQAKKFVQQENLRNLPPTKEKTQKSSRVGLMSLLQVRLLDNGYALLGNQS